MVLMRIFRPTVVRLCRALLCVLMLFSLGGRLAVANPAAQLPAAPLDVASQRFSFPVVPGGIYFIDPVVAAGYTDGREVRSGVYDLFVIDGAGEPVLATASLVRDGRRFRVAGVETPTTLSATDPTSFITGLGFVMAGVFMGPEMDEPADLSEPALVMLLVLGMGLLVLSRRHIGLDSKTPERTQDLTKRRRRSRL